MLVVARRQSSTIKGQGPGLVNVLCVDANGRIVLMLFTIVQQTHLAVALGGELHAGGLSVSLNEKM